MSHKEDESFRDLNKKNKILVILAISLIIVIALGLVAGAYFFGFAGLFSLIGVEYQSIWSLVLFIAAFFLIGFVIDVPIEAMTQFSVENMSSRFIGFITQMIYSFAANWLALAAADWFIDSIDLSGKTKLMLTVILAFIDPLFDNKQNKNDDV